MHHSHPLKKRYELERTKIEWLESRITERLPEWAQGYRGFEYNTLSDFWRKSYHHRSRQLIRDYERLVAAMDVPAPYVIIISNSYIYIERPHQHVANRYESMVANIPMESPVEPEAIWHSIWQNKEVDLHDCSFQNIRKSHAFHSYHRAPMLRLETFMNRWLGPLGYTMQMLSKGRGGGTEYVLGITHDTESANGFLEQVTEEGYKPLQPNKAAKPRKTIAQAVETSLDDLAAREQQLLQELADLRTQRDQSNSNKEH